MDLAGLPTNISYSDGEFNPNNIVLGSSFEKLHRMHLFPDSERVRKHIIKAKLGKSGVYRVKGLEFQIPYSGIINIPGIIIENCDIEKLDCFRVLIIEYCECESSFRVRLAEYSEVNGLVSINEVSDLINELIEA